MNKPTPASGTAGDELLGRAWSVAQIEKNTSFSDKEIRDAINRGELPHIRRGRRIAVLVSDVHDWLLSQRVTTA